jgi:hypothetical protein
VGGVESLRGGEDGGVEVDVEEEEVDVEEEEVDVEAGCWSSYQ